MVKHFYFIYSVISLVYSLLENYKTAFQKSNKIQKSCIVPSPALPDTFPDPTYNLLQKRQTVANFKLIINRVNRIYRPLTDNNVKSGIRINQNNDSIKQSTMGGSNYAFSRMCVMEKWRVSSFSLQQIVENHHFSEDFRGW
ncbi:hypothetical protein NQ318_011563, partial [Aromia moschata]